MTIVVEDYDAAINFFTGKLQFDLIEDSYTAQPDKRWVVVAPAGAREARFLLARAVGSKQSASIGNQAGGRVFAFLHTDDFWRDYEKYRSNGVRFLRTPTEQTYGTVAVFEDICGNRWDLIQSR